MISNITHDSCWYKQFCTLYNSDKCNDVCISFYVMKHLLDSSGIPENLYSQIDLRPDVRDVNAFMTLKGIKDDIRSFISKGRSLYIWSKNTGNGKTSWAIKLLKSYFHAVHFDNGLKPRGFFIHTPSYLLDCKHRFTNDGNLMTYKMIQITDEFNNDLLTMTNLLNIDVIVWDEIGSNKFSQYDYMNLLSIIDQRCLRGKSNIFTSNYSIDELQESIGERLTSRISKDLSVIELCGDDRRGGSF